MARVTASAFLRLKRTFCRQLYGIAIRTTMGNCQVEFRTVKNDWATQYLLPQGNPSCLS